MQTQFDVEKRSLTWSVDELSFVTDESMFKNQEGRSIIT